MLAVTTGGGPGVQGWPPLDITHLSVLGTGLGHLPYPSFCDTRGVSGPAVTQAGLQTGCMGEEPEEGVLAALSVCSLVNAPCEYRGVRAVLLCLLQPTGKPGILVCDPYPPAHGCRPESLGTMADCPILAVLSTRGAGR